MIENLLRKYRSIFHPVVNFNVVNDKLLKLDFTLYNKTLTEDIINDTEKFCLYINSQLQNAKAKYGIGGYNELRTVYLRSEIFNGMHGSEPRRLHLGVDIWGKPGTPVFAPVGGMVHSFAFNDNLGDYGTTIILLHQLEGVPFYTLYGHISLKDLEYIKEGNYISIGKEFAHFGLRQENGHWPPHLHFQIITDMEYKKGDYPGVCRYSERQKYLLNCPDPDLILNLMQYVSA